MAAARPSGGRPGTKDDPKALSCATLVEFEMLENATKKMLQNAYLLAKIGFDTAQNELTKVWQVSQYLISSGLSPPLPPSEVQGLSIMSTGHGRPQVAPRDPGRAFRCAGNVKRRTAVGRKFRIGGAKLCYTYAWYEPLNHGSSILDYGADCSEKSIVGKHLPRSTS